MLFRSGRHGGRGLRRRLHRSHAAQEVAGVEVAEHADELRAVGEIDHDRVGLRQEDAGLDAVVVLVATDDQGRRQDLLI